MSAPQRLGADPISRLQSSVASVTKSDSVLRSLSPVPPSVRLLLPLCPPSVGSVTKSGSDLWHRRNTEDDPR